MDNSRSVKNPHETHTGMKKQGVSKDCKRR